MSRLAHDNHGHRCDGFQGPEAERLRALEERLRRMNWPQPAPGVRERTLAELHRRLGELTGPLADGGSPEDGAAEREDPLENPSRRRDVG